MYKIMYKDCEMFDGATYGSIEDCVRDVELMNQEDECLDYWVKWDGDKIQSMEQLDKIYRDVEVLIEMIENR